MAIDSCYGAYLKAHYTYEFYKVMLEMYTKNKDLHKVSLIKQEMKYFNISVGDIKFGLDNSGFVIDKINSKINQSMSSVKFINSEIPSQLNEIYINYKQDFRLCIDKIISETSVNSRQFEVLTKIGYFSEFAPINKTLKYYEYNSMLFGKKQLSKSKIEPFIKELLTKDFTSRKETVEKNISFDKCKDYMEILKTNKKTYKVRYEQEIIEYKHCDETDSLYKNFDSEWLLEQIWNALPDEDASTIDKIKWEIEYLGYIQTEYSNKEYKIAEVKWSGVSRKKNNGCFLVNLQTKNEIWLSAPKNFKLPPKESIIWLKGIKKLKGNRYEITDYEIIKE